MIDIKKLITGFLIFAAITSSFAFVFSGLTQSDKPTISKIEKQPEERQQTPPSMAASAFVEAIPEPRAGKTANLISGDSLPPIELTSNLTEGLAQRLAREIVAANTESPLTEEGLVKLIRDNIGEKRDILAKNGIDFNGLPQDGELKMSGDGGVESVINYFNSLNDTLSKTILSGDFDSLTKKQMSMEVVTAIETFYDKASREIKNIPTPIGLADLHKNLIRMVENRKMAIGLATGRQNDPLLKLALMEAASEQIGEVFSRDADGVRDELEKIDPLKLSGAQNKNELFSGIKSLFAVEKARAQFVPVVDPGVISAIGALTTAVGAAATAEATDDARSWVQKALEWAQNFALQILKNTLISEIQGRITSWVKGGGNPKFITNWGDFGREILNQTAGAAIEQIVPGLCGDFSALVGINLNLSYGRQSVGSSCTLDRVISNITNFYNDFEDGGWLAYGAQALPTGNYYGSIFVAAQVTEKKAQDAKDAAKNKGIAGLGFLGTEVCSDNTEAQQGKCPDGSEPQVRTPGQLVTGQLSRALGSNIDLIANANSIEGVAAAAAVAAINTLITSGLSGLLGM